MLCFPIFRFFPKCLHISIYFSSSETPLVLFSRAVFFSFFYFCLGRLLFFLDGSNNELLI